MLWPTPVYLGAHILVKSRVVTPVYILQPSAARNMTTDIGVQARGKQRSRGPDPLGDLGLTLTRRCLCFLPFRVRLPGLPARSGRPRGTPGFLYGTQRASRCMYRVVRSLQMLPN